MNSLWKYWFGTLLACLIAFSDKKTFCYHISKIFYGFMYIRMFKCGHGHVEVKGHTECLPLRFLKRSLAVPWSLPIQPGRLTDQQAPRIILFLFPQNWYHRHMMLYPAFFVSIGGSKLQCLCVLGEHFVTDPSPWPSQQLFSSSFSYPILTLNFIAFCLLLAYGIPS